MLCCLNPVCHNPPNPDRTMFCSNCGTGLVVLRNRYRPIKTLGGGGFGKTYLAEDIDKLNEHCVIKQFAPQVQGTSALNKATELFQQEAKQLQHLGNHPQIPTLLAYFEQDNRLYLVQEFIEGQNLLVELQQQGIFNEQKVRELLLDLLDILKTVHQQKVIHRDIKPENIIRRGDGKFVLIDFGASKQLTATVMTQVGTTIGSFGYAPLEQMQGGQAYPASDLYSIGATCFHMLSGIHPWELWQRQGYGWVTSWRQYLQQPVSQELGRMLDKLLQEEYQQRYQSVAEVLKTLNSEPIPVTQPVTHAVTPPPRQKNSIPIYLIVIPLIVLIGGGTVYLLGLTNPGRIEQKSADIYYKEGIEKYNNKDFRGAIEDYTQAIQINPNYVDAYINRGLAHDDLGDKQVAIEDYNQAIKINPNYALAYYNRGVTRSNSGDRQAAIEDYNQAIKINPNYALAYYNRGVAQDELGNKQAAIEDYSQAIKINPNYANVYINRGVIRSALGDKQAAIQDYNQAIQINPDYALAYYNRGVAQDELGDKQAAIEDYNQAIRINPDYALAYYNRGVIRYELRDKQAAIEDYNQAIKINPNYANAYYNRGLARSTLGDKQAAIEDFRKSADLYKQEGKENDYEYALKRIKQLEK
ncbi:MAG: tetratricopeptide repeat protein [Nostoc sp. ChiQUE02]|uniref:tetratricopeptide repeat protein n=1 Tax=Nostoc sp. ChiQUE02 TaxID=3075377 RepID=UPI002AD48637|nr:tetratricopeptide repeat protein [Nostoc sp. ChiQUE02]MDZ8232431.1 tetratricopeptide repeat protein [Nostoc sp. ChiQUE02]